jgi:uncharacterized membrane protein (DUF4010 family)
MVDWVLQNVPPNGVGLVVVLFLSLLIGLEREEHKGDKPSFFFGGVRTYPLIALGGYLLVIIAPGSFVPFTAGLLVLGALLSLLYWSKLGKEHAGFTTEFSGLATYVMGAVVGVREYWLAIAVTVIVVFLVHMKQWLEDMSRRIPADEITTFAKFLVITAVVLPILPNAEYTRFRLNPYTTWMVVVAVSGISYGSYLLQLKLKERSGLLAASLLGGIYSSTATTVVLAKHSKGKGHPALFAGGVLIASSVMYLRVTALLLLFNRALFDRLAVLFTILGVLGVAGGTIWVLLGQRKLEAGKEHEAASNKNPLQISTAFVFATLFVGILMATRAAFEWFGTAGVYILAGIMGLVDVDPFILGLTQTSPANNLVAAAAVAIVVATASNNLAKAGYATFFGGWPLGRYAAAALAAMSGISLLALGVL